MINIVLEDKYRIVVCDENNLSIEVKKSILNKKQNEYYDKWIHYGYYGKLSSAINGMLELKIKESTVKSINELIDYIKKTKEDIIKIIDKNNKQEEKR